MLEATPMRIRINCDGALKDYFVSERPGLLTDLTGGIPVVEFLNVDLPKVLERRADIVMTLQDDSLFHVEFQSTNRSDIMLRMAEYYLLLRRRFRRRRVRQAVLFTGPAKLRMKPRLIDGPMSFRCEIHDIREWSAEALLRSPNEADRLLAMLGTTADLSDVVNRIVSLTAAMPVSQRSAALATLKSLASLRGVVDIIKKEENAMPIYVDISTSPLFREEYKDLMAKFEAGRKEAQEEGLELGREEGIRTALKTALRAAFTRVPRWASDRIDHASHERLMDWIVRVHGAANIEAVIGKRP